MNATGAPCRQAASNAETAECFYLASKSADRDLNAVYSQIEKVLSADDRERLVNAQRIWLQFRDATCTAERSLYGSGTGAAPAYSACLEELTRQRTADLKTIYGWRIEKFSK